MPEFTGFICTRQPRKRCHYCGQPATRLCDHPVKSGTCDRPTCASHCRRIDDNTDYCLTHAQYAANKGATQNG